MSVDYNQHFIDFLFDALNEYRARLPGQKLSAKMWKEEGFRCWDAWHASKKKQRKKNLITSPWAERIYALYPRKVGKLEALRAIVNSLGRLAPEEMERRVTVYAQSTALWSKEEKKFIPHPATWFNQGCYDDDPNEWLKGHTLKKKVQPVPEPPEWQARMKKHYPSSLYAEESRPWLHLMRDTQLMIVEVLSKHPWPEEG